MLDEILKIATAQGLWATLSVVLIFYILRSQEKRDKRQEEREEKYQAIISRLADQLHIVEEIKEDIEKIIAPPS